MFSGSWITSGLTSIGNLPFPIANNWSANCPATSSPQRRTLMLVSRCLTTVCSHKKISWGKSLQCYLWYRPEQQVKFAWNHTKAYMYLPLAGYSLLSPKECSIKLQMQACLSLCWCFIHYNCLTFLDHLAECSAFLKGMFIACKSNRILCKVQPPVNKVAAILLDVVLMLSYLLC